MRSRRPSFLSEVRCACREEWQIYLALKQRVICRSGRVRDEAEAGIHLLWNVQETSVYHNTQKMVHSRLKCISRQRQPVRTEDYTASLPFLKFSCLSLPHKMSKCDLMFSRRLLINNKFFSDVTLCGLVEIYRHFKQKDTARVFRVPAQRWVISVGLEVLCWIVWGTKLSIIKSNIFKIPNPVFKCLTLPLHRVLRSNVNHIRSQWGETMKGKNGQI